MITFSKPSNINIDIKTPVSVSLVSYDVMTSVNGSKLAKLTVERLLE